VEAIMHQEEHENDIQKEIVKLKKKRISFDKADIEQIEQLVNKCRAQGLQEQLAEILLLKARYLAGTSKSETASILFDEAMSIAESLDSATLKATVFKSQAFVKKLFCQYDEAISFELKALNQLVGTDQYTLRCDILKSIGASYLRRGDVVNSYKQLQKAFKIANEHNILRSQAEILAWLSEIELENENYDKAVEIMMQSNNILLDLGDWQNYASNLNIIGTFHVSNLDQSLFYYKKAEEISREHNYVDELSDALNNIGAVYFDKKEYDTAIKYYKKSLDISSNYKYTTNYANTLLNIADIYKLQNNYTKALEYYESGLEISKNTDSPFAIIEGHISLSEFYYHFVQYDKALQSVQKVLDQAIEIDDASYLMRIYKVYYQAYEKKELYEKAYEYLNLYRKYLSINENQIILKKMKNISNQFEKDIIEREAKKAAEVEAIKGKMAMAVTANHYLNQPLMLLQGNLDLITSKLIQNNINICDNYINNLQAAINSFTKRLAKHKMQEEK